MINVKRFSSTIALLLAGGLIFTACDDDDDDEPTPAPEFEFVRVAGDDVNQDDIYEHTVGDTIEFDIRVSADAGLDELTITQINGGSDQIHQEDLEGASSERIEFEYIPGSEEIDDLQFDVYDEEEQRSRFIYSMDISADDEGEPLRTSEEVQLMGAHESQEHPSFFDANNFEGFMVGQAEENQEYIDFVYFWGATNEATLSAPIEEEPTEFGVYDEDGANLSQWDQRNATTFRVTDAEYEEVNYVEELDTYWEEADQLENPGLANQLSEDDVLIYLTQSGQLGILHINEINEDTDGYIEFDIKVEE